MFSLPTAYLWQEGVAGAAAGAGEEQHHRPARSSQGVEGERFALEVFESKRGSRGAHLQPPSRLPRASTVEAVGSTTAGGTAVLQRFYAHQEATVLPEEVHQEPLLPGEQTEQQNPQDAV
jgi:hypothetical protein